jgi:hypothetical protein
MAVKYTLSRTRANSATLFWQPAQSYNDHRKANYIDTGKLLTVENVLENNTRTITLTFLNQAGLDDWLSDPVRLSNKANHDSYNLANDITGYSEVSIV